MLVELRPRAPRSQVGVEVDVAQSLGSTVIFDALVNGDVDVYVDYSGTLWTNAMKRPAGRRAGRSSPSSRAGSRRKHRVRSLGSLGFENTYALAVRRETATKLDLHDLHDLTAHAPSL